METKLNELLWAIESLETELTFFDKDNPDVDFLINTLEVVIEKAKNYNSSMQTQVYLYSIKKIAKDILGIDVDYENISMTYFNPENKLELAKVVYSKELDELYYENISQLIEKIYNYNYQNFDRNKYIKSCKFCEFNLFCSNIKEKDVEFSEEIDFDTIDEFI